MSWRVNLFGEFGLTGPEGRKFQTKSLNSKVLLAWLASMPNLRASRRIAADSLFDPGEVPSASNLSVLLNRTRASLVKAGDSPLLLSDGEFIWLDDSALVVDAVAVREATTRLKASPEDVQACFALAEVVADLEGFPLRDLDHPLLMPVRRELQEIALNALVVLASGPLVSQFRLLIFQKLEALQLLSPPSSGTIERLLTITGRLRMRDLLLQTYLQFEELLADELGELPSPEVSSLLERLLEQIELAPAPTPAQNVPPRPQSTFGDAEWVARLNRQILSSPNTGQIHAVVGQSGIGKSHFLHELYWLLDERMSLQFIDLSKIPPDRVLSYLSDQAFDAILLDHLEPEHFGLLPELSRAHPHCPIVVSSPARLPGTVSSTVMIRGLELGTALDAGPAMELILASRAAVLSHTEREPLDLACVHAIAGLCDGIPLALQFAGKLSATIGLAQTQKSLSRDLRALGAPTSGIDARHASLSNAIRSSYDYLSPGGQATVRLLTWLDSPCHIDHLMEAGELQVFDIEDALMSGLVIRDSDSGYVRIVRSTALVVRDLIADSEIRAMAEGFDLRTTAWFTSMSAQVPLDLSAAPSASLGVATATRLFQAGSQRSACELLASLRGWLGSGVVASEQVSELTPHLMADDLPTSPVWISAVLSLGAALFHNGDYGAMHSLLVKACDRASCTMPRTDLECQLRLQLALSERCLGEIDKAVAGYRAVCEDHAASAAPATLVKGFFNLGTTLEAVGRLPEALAALDQAREHLGNEADARTESLILLGIARLRFRLGDDLREVGLVFEALMAHAQHRNDHRILAEILQNSGLIYVAQGDHLSGALAETLGSAYLLQFGYSTEFRRLSRSSFVTLASALKSLGHGGLAHRSRILVDRLGSAELYAPNQALFEELERQTFVTPAEFHLSIAPEREIIEHLRDCYRELLSAPASDIRPALSGIAVPALLAGTVATRVPEFEPATLRASK